MPAHLARLDAFIASQDERPTRAEAVRRLLDHALPNLGVEKLISATAESDRASKPGKVTKTP